MINRQGRYFKENSLALLLNFWHGMTISLHGCPTVRWQQRQDDII
jgi:hypothetical protein